MVKTIIILATLLVVLFLYGCDAIASYLAFHPDSVYAVFPDKFPPHISEVSVKTEDNITLKCFLLKQPVVEKAVIYFHGNAGNISHRLPDLQNLYEMGYTVLGVSYRGYGKSEGKPSEKGIYRDGEAAIRYCIDTLGVPLESITLFGRSIGSTVAVQIAQNRSLEKIILVSPLTSGKELMKGTIFYPAAGKAFNNIGKIENVTSPILIVHGTDDQIIPFSMGKLMYEAANEPKKMIAIEKADHNDIEFYPEYWESIREFLQ